ncbi:unnamed protein product [Arctogadus glacialis]
MSNRRPRKVRMGSSRRHLDRTSLLAHDVTPETQADPRSITAVDMDSVNSEHGNQLDFKEPISETSEGLAFASEKCGSLIHPPTTFEIDAHSNQFRSVSPKLFQPQKEVSGNRNENAGVSWSNDLTREQCREFSANIKESKMGMLPYESCEKTTLQISKPGDDTHKVSQSSGVFWHPRLNSSLYSSPCQPLTGDLSNSTKQSSDSIIHKEEVEREFRKEDSNKLAVSLTGTIAEGQEYLLQVEGICGDVPSLMKEHEVSNDVNPLLKQSEHPTQSVVCPLLIEVPNQEEAEQEQITYTTTDSHDSTGNSVIVVESQPLLTMQYTLNPSTNQEMTIQDNLENTKRDPIFDMSELGHNLKEKSFSQVCDSEQNSDGTAVDASGLVNDVKQTEVASNQEQVRDLDMKSSMKKRRMGSSRRIGNQGKGGGEDHSGEIESDFSTDLNKTNKYLETELKVEMKCDLESLEGGTLGTSTDKVDCLLLMPPQSEIKERGSEDIIDRARKETYTGGHIHLSPDISLDDGDERKEDESEGKGEIVETIEVIKIPLSKSQKAEVNNQEITEKLSSPYHEENLCRAATEPQEKDISPPGAVFDLSELEHNVKEKTCSQEFEPEGHVNNKSLELIEDTAREEGEGHPIKVGALQSEYSSASADDEYDLTFPTRSGTISFNDGSVDNPTKLPITELMEPEKNQSANEKNVTLDSKKELKHGYNNDSNITTEFNPQSDDVEHISSNVTLSDSHSIDDLAVESCLSTNMREIHPLATVPQHVPSSGEDQCYSVEMFAPTSSQLQDDGEQVGAQTSTRLSHSLGITELGLNKSYLENENPVEMPEVENDLPQNSDGTAEDASGLNNDVKQTEVASNQEQDRDLDTKSSMKKRRMGSSRRIGNQGKGGGGDHSGEIVESDFSTDLNKTNKYFETELKVEMKCDSESLEGGTLGTSTDKVDCLLLIAPQSEIKERGTEEIIERARKEIYTGGNIHLPPVISYPDVDKRKEDEIVEKMSHPYHEEDPCRPASDPQDKDIRPPGVDVLMLVQNSLSKENAPHSLDINSSILFAPVSDIRENDDKMDTAGQHQTALSSNVDHISGHGNHGSLRNVKDDDNHILRRRKMGSSRWTKGSATGSQEGSKKAHTTEDKEIKKDAVLSETISEGPEKVVTAEEEPNQIGSDTHQSMSEAPKIVRRKLGSNNMTGRMTPIQENSKEKKEVESEVSEDRKIFKDELRLKVNKDNETEQSGERSFETDVKPVTTTLSALPIELSNDLHVEGRRRKLGSQRKSRGQHRHDYPPESKDHGALIFGDHLPPTEPLSWQISGDATLTFDTLNKCDRRANCFNVVMVGSSNVGKTSFMKRIQSGSYSPDFSASIGIDTCIHALPVDGREVMLQIWDTAGQERFHSISKQIFHKGQAFLLMYDITSSVSFTDVRYWISCIQASAGEEVIMLLLGNKSDCAGREVTPSEGKLLAKEYNIDFNECSVATGEHIVSSIESLARKLTENYHKIEEDVVLQQQPKKRCC